MIPHYNYVGPAIAFVCAETLTVALWIFQMRKLGYPAHLGNVLWRPLAAGAAMAGVLYLCAESSLIWQLAGAGLSVLSYGAVLLALRTFSSEEISQAEGNRFLLALCGVLGQKLRRDS